MNVSVKILSAWDATIGDISILKLFITVLYELMVLNASISSKRLAIVERLQSYSKTEPFS